MRVAPDLVPAEQIDEHGPSRLVLAAYWELRVLCHAGFPPRHWNNALRGDLGAARYDLGPSLEISIATAPQAGILA